MARVLQHIEVEHALVISDKLFVYGILKNHPHFSELAEEVGDGQLVTTQPYFTMYNLGAYPAVIPEGNTRIVGKVFKINKDALRLTDTIEGYPNFYTRGTIYTDLGLSWMYYLPRTAEEMEEYPIVEGGEWHGGL